MRWRILAVAFLFGALGGLVALGQTPNLWSDWLVSAQSGTEAREFAVDDDPDIVFRQLMGPPRSSRSFEITEIERPPYAVWPAVFDTVKSSDFSRDLNWRNL